MQNQSYENLRFAFLQDFLPVGVALYKRAKENGPNGLVDIFSTDQINVDDLKAEGESGAKFIRDKLDSIKPGLGNPVITVNVEEVQTNITTQDEESLREFLRKVETRLDSLIDILETDNNIKTNNENA
tara:strand:- start:904 stop:1287 length:384 start_codon:yes stop_codon:yes gene_type:complete